MRDFILNSLEYLSLFLVELGLRENMEATFNIGLGSHNDGLVDLGAQEQAHTAEQLQVGDWLVHHREVF